MTGFEIYRTYCALKAHFNSKFDFTKSGTCINIKRNNYDKRKDRLFFESLSNKHMDYVVPFLVANFIDNPNAWIGDLQLNVETQEIYFEWKKRVSNLFRNADKELNTLKTFMNDNKLDFNSIFELRNNKAPILYRMTAQGYLNIETYMVVDCALNCHQHISDLMEDDPVFELFNRRVLNYRPFLLLKQEKCLRLVKKIFLDTEAK